MMSKIIEICINDIFGAASEEKEVTLLTRRTPEAKPSKKSFLIINILASNIGESSILDLLIPFKEILIATNSKKTVSKLQECFQQMVKGFFENTNISTESMLMFIYGTISESIPDLTAGSVKPQLTVEEREKLKRARPDTFIVPAEPKRRGALNHVGKINAKTNVHVLVEFGLELLFMLLKRKKLMEIDYQAFLDPIIGILVSALTSNHVRVTTITINCLSSMWNTKLDVAKLESSMTSIVDEMFKILHKYATSGLMRKDENYHLVNNTFKAMVTILRYVKYYTYSEEQMKALLLYVEQDISVSDKQSIAFTLLNAIVQRKLVAAELNNVMKKVSQICIISDSTATR
jgi:U3 small nucleolar RNA-associated protein 20